MPYRSTQPFQLKRPRAFAAAAVIATFLGATVLVSARGGGAGAEHTEMPSPVQITIESSIGVGTSLGADR